MFNYYYESCSAGRPPGAAAPPGPQLIFIHPVSFNNFKSQKFKLSVSNPKSKYVAYSSVLSQVSNYQGLGRKNKHEILKTDRIHQLCKIQCTLFRLDTANIYWWWCINLCRVPGPGAGSAAAALAGPGEN